MSYKKLTDLPPKYQEQVRAKTGPARTKLPYPFEFRLDYDLKSVNEFTGPKSMFKRSNELLKFLELLHYQKLGRIETPQHRQRVTYTRVLAKGAKLLDSANITGGSLKQLQDAMKQVGFFVDDSDKWIDIQTAQEATERPERGYTLVRLERL
jgi:hypothetical protein